MPSQSHEHWPASVSGTPKEEVEKVPEDASNDPSYRDLDKLSPTDLFKKRKAHEITARLGLRDPKIDADEVVMIQDEMRKRGLTEDDYKKFLATYKKEEN